MSQRKPQMLMSLEQMVTSKFPFPSEYFGEQLCNGTIRSTRKIYHQVSETSPIFTLDCEMCQTTIQQLELTRISVVYFFIFILGIRGVKFGVSDLSFSFWR